MKIAIQELEDEPPRVIPFNAKIFVAAMYLLPSSASQCWEFFGKAEGVTLVEKG